MRTHAADAVPATRATTTTAMPHRSRFRGPPRSATLVTGTVVTGAVWSGSPHAIGADGTGAPGGGTPDVAAPGPLMAACGWVMSSPVSGLGCAWLVIGSPGYRRPSRLAAPPPRRASAGS